MHSLQEATSEAISKPNGYKCWCLKNVSCRTSYIIGMDKFGNIRCRIIKAWKYIKPIPRSTTCVKVRPNLSMEFDDGAAAINSQVNISSNDLPNMVIMIDMECDMVVKSIYGGHNHSPSFSITISQCVALIEEASSEAAHEEMCQMVSLSVWHQWIMVDAYTIDMQKIKGSQGLQKSSFKFK